MPRIKFDVTVPIFAGAVPNRSFLDYGKIVELVKLCEDLDYNTLWVADHLTMGENHRIWEGWTIFASLVNTTSRIRMGTAMLNVLHRNPALLAKMAATFDVISGGRLDFGVGAGWHETELKEYNLPWFDRPQERIQFLRETIEIAKKMWTEDRPTYSGRFFQIRDAYCEPKPIQKPHPPIWIGGGGEKLLLRLVAQLADGWDIPATSPESYSHKVEVLRNHCKEVGTNFDHIERSIDTNIIISQDPAMVNKVREWYNWLRGLQSEVASLKPAINVENLFIIGSVSQCTKRIEEYAKAGVQRFKFYFFDYPSLESATIIGKEIIPCFE